MSQNVTTVEKPQFSTGNLKLDESGILTSGQLGLRQETTEHCLFGKYYIYSMCSVRIHVWLY